MEITELVDKTFTKVYKKDDDSELTFELSDGGKYVFYHEQDCCETVEITDIVGDLQDLAGSPIVSAFERTYDMGGAMGTSTWTFHNFVTLNVWVTVRWFGESNGYSSESVSLRYEENNFKEV